MFIHPKSRLPHYQEDWDGLPANKYTSNQKRVLNTLDDKTHYYRKDGWLVGEKRLVLKKLLVHINDYLKFQVLLRSDKKWSYSRIMSVKHEYAFADDYLFSDWEHIQPLDCRYDCNIAGIQYEWLVRWLQNISLEETERILKILHF
ncbi:MAG TPA: hypothetical protein ENH82_08005 [bacterium]|nr:hypothetical protein [bacterium]